jgi:predicted DNA-binding ribbon-helix-helix protein
MYQKRSLSIRGHKTSLLLEAEFWQELEIIAKSRSISMPQLIFEIDEKRGTQNLASSCRVFVLKTLKGNEN